MISNTTDKTIEYVLQRDRELPENERTVFELGMLSARQKMQVYDELVSADETGRLKPGALGTSCLRACQAGIRGIRNLRDIHGKDTSYRARRPGSLVPEEILDAITGAIIELGQEIMRLNGLTGDEAAAGTPAGGERGNS